MEDIKKEILSIEENIVKAFNKGKIDEIMQYFNEDLLAFSSTAHERLGGLKEFKKTFEYYLDQSQNMEYQISSPLVKVFDNAAFITFYWVVALTGVSSRKEIHGRGSHFFIKRDGDWKIVHEHYSRAIHA